MGIQVPLKILLTDKALLNEPLILEQCEALRKAGHSVEVAEPYMLGYDFIAGPNCWLLRSEVAGLFTMAVKNARVIANADQERVDQIKATRASKKPARAVSKRTTRSVKATSDVTSEQLTSGSTNTDPQADSFAAGS